MPTPRPTVTQMEAAQLAYGRRLDANQNARLAKRQAAIIQSQTFWARTGAPTAQSGNPTHLYDSLFGLSQFFAACLLLGAFIAAVATRRAARRKTPPATALNATSYTAAASLLTPTEAKFHAMLAEAVGPMATIQCKVRLADLLISRPGDLGALRRVSQKHVDFVLCDKTTLRPLVAVELDDSSHDRADRQERDRFVDGAYAQAGLPLLHVPVQGEYHTAQLLAQLQPHLLRRFSLTV